jgi:hypothetical protein
MMLRDSGLKAFMVWVEKDVVGCFVNWNGDMNVHVAYACAAVMCMVRAVANRSACGLDVEAFPGQGSRLAHHTLFFMIAECKDEH